MNTKTNGLSYVGDVNMISRYTLYLEGRRVMDVLVDNAITELPPAGVELGDGVSLHPISIAMVDAPEVTRQATNGLAARRPYMDESGVTTRVSATTVQTYVYPRAAQLLARLFVPTA